MGLLARRGGAMGRVCEVSKFVETQPRAPKGTSTGGQWVKAGYEGIRAGSVTQADVERSWGGRFGFTAPEEHEKAPLLAYVGGMHREFNLAARQMAGEESGDRVPPDVVRSTTDETRAKVQVLAGYIRKQPPLGVDHVVFRGNGDSGKSLGVAMAPEDWVAKPVDGKLTPYMKRSAEAWAALEGKYITENGFLSTSVSEEATEMWLRDRATKAALRVKFDIRVPRGTRGLYVNHAVRSNTSNEFEYLLPPGATMRVDKVTVNQYPDRSYLPPRLEVQMTLIPDEVEKAYNPDQPRAPKGTESGGQWVSMKQSDRVLNATFKDHKLIGSMEGFSPGFDHYRQDGNRIINGFLRAEAKGDTIHDFVKRHWRGVIDPEKDVPGSEWYDGRVHSIEESVRVLDAEMDAAPPLKAEVTVFRSINNGVRLTGGSWDNVRVSPDEQDLQDIYYRIRNSRFGSSELQAAHDDLKARADRVKDFWESRIGQEFIDPGFVSTTTSDKQVAKWIKKAGKSKPWPTIIKIRVPPGTKGLWAPRVAKESDVVVKKEFLLPRGSRFRVVSVKPYTNPDPRREGSHFEVEMELVQ